MRERLASAVAQITHTAYTVNDLMARVGTMLWYA